MWESVIEKIQLLEQLDLQRQAFGAQRHRYAAAAPLSETEIAVVEARLGCVLPTELASFYREVGDGGVGPHYGIVPGASLRIEDAKYLLIGEQGCGHRTYVIASGPNTNAIAFQDLDEDGFTETAISLRAFYENWLDGELAAFREVRRLIGEGLSAEAIALELSTSHQRHDGRDLVASIIDAPKPAQLFGSQGQRIYHGASQFPWYESRLGEFRRRVAAAGEGARDQARWPVRIRKWAQSILRRAPAAGSRRNDDK